MVHIISFICVALIVISAIFVAIGWYYISKRNIEAHKKHMLIAACTALAFFLLYAARTIFIGNTKFGGPEEYKTAYQSFLFFHVILATSGGVFGLVTLWQAFKGQFVKHKKIGPWTSIIWFFTAITGVMVYCLLYVFFTPGETDNVFRVLLGK